MIKQILVEFALAIIINGLMELLSIHPLIAEDIFNTSHLPKFEAFDQYYFLTIKDIEEAV